MLQIFLLCLKIIGIILAVLLALIIVILLLLLFAPFRYIGEATVSPEKKVTAGFRVRYLLGLLRAYCSYGEDFDFQVKVLWFTVYPRKEKYRKEESEEEFPERPSCSEQLPEEKIEQPVLPKNEEVIEEPKEDLPKKEPTKEGKKQKKKKRKFKQYTKTTIYDKIKGVIYKIRDFNDFLEKKSSKKTWEMIRKYGIYLLKKLKPDRLSGYLHFGFEDPATTGYCLGLFGIFYSLWATDFRLEPDFEQEVMEGDVILKGKLRLFPIARTGLVFFISKTVRKTWSDLKSIGSVEEEENE